MKKQILSAIVILSLVLTACAQSKKATTSVRSNNINYISMERTACFGTCPHYIIEIYESGLVRYSGRTFADPKGVYEKDMDKAMIQKLFSDFEAYRADTCSEVYPLMIADLPGLKFIIKYENNKTKTIQNAHFGPGFLKTLAEEIDNAIKPGKSWNKTADFKEDN